MKSQNPFFLSGRLVYVWCRPVLGLTFLCIFLLLFGGCGGGSDDAAASAPDSNRDASPTVAGCDGDLFIQAPVEAIDANSQTLTLFDLTIRADDRTRFNRVNLADLAVGDYVDTRATEADGGIVATCLEYEGVRDEVELHGPVDADGIAAPRLSILGVEIQTGANTVFEQGRLTQAAFFAQVQSDDLVEVEGQLQADGSIRAEEIEFDDDDDGDDFDDDDGGASAIDLDDDDDGGFDDDDDD